MDERKLSRRTILKTLSLFTIGGGIFTQLWMFVRSIVPNVLYEPLKKFKIGTPDAFASGITFLSEERVFVIKEGNEFSAMSAVCTHLGCTVNNVKLSKEEIVELPDGTDLKQKWEFHCPCHGSKYRGDGTDYDGPAPEALPYWEMSLAPDGSIIVDTGKPVNKTFRLKA
jgi:menaquinol-cytochrome c reductase iron-sulfur subunit